MTDQILIALISFAGTLAGSLAGIFTASRLSNYRIEQLEKKVDKHNNQNSGTQNSGFGKRTKQGKENII